MTFKFVSETYSFPSNKDSLGWCTPTPASVENACIWILVPLQFHETRCNPRESKNGQKHLNIERALNKKVFEK